MVTQINRRVDEAAIVVPSNEYVTLTADQEAAEVAHAKEVMDSLREGNSVTICESQSADFKEDCESAVRVSEYLKSQGLI